MDTLFACLATLTDRQLGTVVHVGAGHARILEQYAEQAIEHVVLVEGDPEFGPELLRQASIRPGVTVRDVAVAPQAGSVDWHRYNLPSLNGPLIAEPLRPYYVRLRELSTVPRDAVSFADLLQSVTLSGDDRLDVLVMDVPGQEDALCGGVPDEGLLRFGAVLLRGCREADYCGAAVSQAIERLKSSGYALVSRDETSEPLWPVSILRFDAAAGARLKLEQLERALKLLRDEQARITASEEEARRLAQTHMERIGALEQALADATKEGTQVAAELQKVRERLEAELQEACERSNSLETQLQRTTTARDEHRQWHLENEKWAKSLKVDNDRLQAELAALRVGEEVTRGRVAELQEKEASLAAQLTERDARQRLLDVEILKAEAQLDLIKDVLIREKNF